MTSIPALLVHLAANAMAGYAVLRFWPSSRTPTESITSAVLVGFYLESLAAAVLVFCGISFNGSVWIVSSAVVLVFSLGSYYGAGPRPSLARVSSTVSALARSCARPGLRWYEWLLLFSIVEKLAFALWVLTDTPVLFSDTMQMWSGRGRSLYGGVNWSLSPESPHFLGQTANSWVFYPYGVPVWRAVTATYAGQWTEIIARADSLAMYGLLLATVWSAVFRRSHNRLLAAITAYGLVTMPLLTWHAASGYVDIHVATFNVAAVAAVLRRDWVVAGLLAAGAAWMKNIALALYIPAASAAVVVVLLTYRGTNQPSRDRRAMVRGLAQFVGGLMTIVPWLIVRRYYQLGLGQEETRFEWHPEALTVLWDEVVFASTNGLVWVMLGVCWLVGVVYSRTDFGWRALSTYVMLSLAGIVAVFSLTSAFTALNNLGSVYRVGLQISGVALLLAAYSLADIPMLRPSKR